MFSHSCSWEPNLVNLVLTQQRIFIMLQKELNTIVSYKRRKKIQVAIFHCADKNTDIVRIMLTSTYHDMKGNLMRFQSENLK